MKSWGATNEQCLVSTRSGKVFTIDQLLQYKDTFDGEEVMAKDFLAAFAGTFEGFTAGGKPRKGELRLSFRQFKKELIPLWDAVGMVDGLVVEEFQITFDPPDQGQSVVHPVVEQALFGVPNGFQCLMQFRLSPSDPQIYGMYGILMPNLLSGELMEYDQNGRPAPNGAWRVKPVGKQSNDGQSKTKNTPVKKGENVAITNETAQALKFDAVMSSFYKRGATKETYLRALDLLKKADDIEPQNYEILTDTGRVLLKLDRHSEAIAVLKRAIDLYPGFAEPRALLAKAYRLGGDSPMAEKTCVAGLGEFPCSQDLLGAYVGVLEDRHDWKGIKHLIGRVVQTAQMPKAQRMQSVWVVGQASLKNGEREEAKACFQRILNEMPGSPIAEQAEKDLQKITGFSPDGYQPAPTK